MDDFLCKPFSRADLAALIDRWTPGSGAPTAPANADHASVINTSSLDPLPIDMLRALDPHGERHLLQRAVTKFADYSDELIARLAAARSRRMRWRLHGWRTA
ncbi:MAG: hypothetical protein HC871_14330 [Rhizobiales bacterium]|nr:hypothetical protein [Hyphomicrobiales bacterium]